MTDSFGDLRILVVDDSNLARRLLCEMLENLGIAGVVACGSTEDAMAALSDGDFDLVISDWIMEPEDGLALVARIRDISTSPAPRIPVVMISGFADRFPVEDALDAGINEFLPKPLTVQALYQCLGRLQDSTT